MRVLKNMILLSKNYGSKLGNSFHKTNTIFYRNFSTVGKYELDLQINNVSLNNYVKKLENNYKELCKGSNLGDNKQWAELATLMKYLEERKNTINNISNLRDLLEEKDEEIRQLAKEEKLEFENKIKQIDNEIISTLLPKDEHDFNSIVLEVSSGVGGQEAMLFAKEIFDMYCQFAIYKGWSIEVADYQTTDIGGIRHASALIEGNSVFRYLKYEAGVHRVQRTPATEKAGRIHTSTASVIALPQPSDIEINIKRDDLRIETKRATGAGGQHVNTTDSAVRIVHLPTGIMVECQVDRSQIKNRKLAMARIKALLYQRELNSQTAEISAKRKSQVKTNNRNEKIRTYNFNQDRITDHRLQGCNIHNIKVFFEGGPPLEELINKLDRQHKIDSLIDIVNSIEYK